MDTRRTRRRGVGWWVPPPAATARLDTDGYDALARARLDDDRPAEADDAMTTALAIRTRDATLLDHRATLERRS